MLNYFERYNEGLCGDNEESVNLEDGEERRVPVCYYDKDMTSIFFL